MTDDDIRALLREMQDEPVPSDSLARVRLGVAEGTQRAAKHWLSTRWKVIGVLATAALGALLLFVVRSTHTVILPVAKVVQEVPMESVPVPQASPPQRSKVVRTAATKRKTSNRSYKKQTGDGVLVRIETADSDVVILLIGD
jgi:hypothetical protein